LMRLSTFWRSPALWWQPTPPLLKRLQGRLRNFTEIQARFRHAGRRSDLWILCKSSYCGK
jgi:hypothetical protein